MRLERKWLQWEYEFFMYYRLRLLSLSKKQDSMRFDWMQEILSNTETLLTQDAKSTLNRWEEQSKKALNL